MFFFKDSEKEDMKKVLDEMGYSMQNSKDLKRIFTYEFPQVVLERTQKDLKCSSKELDIVKVDFFDYMYTVKKYTHVEMLSSTADVLWHNLILDTKAYMFSLSESFNQDISKLDISKVEYAHNMFYGAKAFIYKFPGSDEFTDVRSEECEEHSR